MANGDAMNADFNIGENVGKQSDSGISWAHYTFNPYWGCEPCSPACAACYADAWANRCGLDLFGHGKPARTFGEKHWYQPISWNALAQKNNTRYRVFCGSMMDIFQDRNDVDLERADLWRTIEGTPNLIWMLLTKRPENAESIIPPRWRPKWPNNVWMGVTAENQEMADKRIPVMLNLNAQFFFVSCEPLLSRILLKDEWLHRGCRPTMDLPERAGVIGWVIVGGESRLKDRPMDPRHVRSIHQQCMDDGVKFHFKQWGQWGISESVNNHEVRNTGTDIIRLGEDRMYLVGKKRAGRILDGKEWLEVPEVA